MEKKRLFTARQIAPWLIFLLIFMFAVWAGLSDPQYQFLQAPGWSRAKLVGETDQRQPVPLVVDDAGNGYFLLVKEETLTVRSITAQGTERWQASYEAWTTVPSQFQLVREDNDLHLLWLEESRLYSAALDLTGEPRQATRQLEIPVAVTFFAAIANADGLHVWASNAASAPGLYAMLNEGEPKLIDEQGFMPQLQLDSTGDLHAIWQRRLGSGVLATQYGTIPVAGQLTETSEIAIINAARARLRGPWFTVEDDFGYLSYAIDILVDPGAGQSFAKYVAFPLGEMGQANDPVDFALPYARVQAYEVVAEGPAGQRAALPNRVVRVVNPLEVASIRSAPNIGDEGVSAVRVSVAHLKQREISQIAVQFWQDGEPNGYQMLTFSGRASQQPSLTSTVNGDLAVTYLEGTPGQYAVYYATTQPATQAAFSQLTVQDYGLFVMDSLTGMLQSITFAPFSFLLWSVVPFIALLVMTYLRAPSASWQDRRFVTYLLIAAGLFWIGKYVTLGSALLSYVPFSAWIPAVDGGVVALLFRLIVPVAITAIAAYVAWRTSYRRHDPSVLVIFVVYALIDTTLSMSIYGGYLYNAF